MRILALTLLGCLAAGATPIWISDPFPGSSGPSADYDVIGALTDFDIESLWGEINPSMTNLHLAFNSRYSDLRPFSASGVQLNIGDLLFEVSGELKYGVPLVDHEGSPNGGPWGERVRAGHLYRINDASRGVLTARQVLNDPPGLIYRPEEEVWLRDDGEGSLTDLVGGSANVIRRGEGNAEYEVKLHFHTPAGFWEDFSSSGFEIFFANATGGNDILEGGIQSEAGIPTPEASTYVMIGLGLLALGGLKVRRAR